MRKAPVLFFCPPWLRGVVHQALCCVRLGTGRPAGAKMAQVHDARRARAQSASLLRSLPPQELFLASRGGARLPCQLCFERHALRVASAGARAASGESLLVISYPNLLRWFPLGADRGSLALVFLSQGTFVRDSECVFDAAPASGGGGANQKPQPVRLTHNRVHHGEACACTMPTRPEGGTQRCRGHKFLTPLFRASLAAWLLSPV